MVWWQNVLVLVGLVLQLLGTWLAVTGLVKTWRAYSADPLVPVWGRAKARLLGLRARARASLLGPRRFERHATDAITAVGEGVAHDATVIARDALPADHDAAIAELDEQDYRSLPGTRGSRAVHPARSARIVSTQACRRYSQREPPHRRSSGSRP